MASKSVLNLENLAALGPDRLAALLMEVATGDATAKRRLRLELAAAESPRKLASDMRKRLISLRVAKNNIGWRSVKPLIAELTALRRLIDTPLSQAEPAEALDLMWTFLDLAESILERTRDTSGAVLTVFQQAREEITAIVEAAKPPKDKLLADLSTAVMANGYGQADGLIANLRPYLDEDGLHQLRRTLTEGAKKAETTPAAHARKTSRWRRGRRLQSDLVARRTKADIVHRALLDIADALGDVDAYIALQPKRGDAATVVAIARRLVDVGRDAEALAALDDLRGNILPDVFVLKAQALEHLGRSEEAQTCRLSGFHQTLAADLLKQYLKRLPDFDDIEAEDEALDFAWQSKDLDRALEFLVRWPSLERAASLVVDRAAEIGSTNDDLILLAVAKLGPRYPLAAVLLLRKLINTILLESRDRDYGRAADYLSEAEQLAAHIDEGEGFEAHKTYLAKLQANFRHRRDFWDLAA